MHSGPGSSAGRSSPVWELKMHIMAEELEKVLVGYSQGGTGREDGSLRSG